MSAEWRILRNAETGAVVLERVRLCKSFWCHFRGLQLVPHLPENEGLLFITPYEGKAHTSIHMFFMRFPIGVLWLNSEGEVVDTALARPWRPAYAPARPARHYLEANPSVLERAKVGDILRFDEVAL
ncbi:MAG: DUF192 domain-containing protein [Chloroflexota bacterium]|nr:MAG: hypothetical protein DIU68_13700 [Chloroflexota bacterium]